MLNIPDYSKLKISVLGDVMLDRYLFGDTERISPEAPVPVINVKKTDERPGGAANVAINLSKFYQIDFEGSPLPKTGNWDIGAIQYNAAKPAKTLQPKRRRP